MEPCIIVPRETRSSLLKAVSDCNCDCACQPVDARPAHPVELHAGARLSLDPSTKVVDLNHDGYSVLISRHCQPVLINQTVARLLDSFQAGGTTAARFDSGTDLWMIRELCALGILTQQGDDATEMKPAAQVLSAWLHVTDRCNLRCSYCYLPHKAATMNRDTGRRAVSALFSAAQKKGFHEVKIKYAGGEPTLQFELVRELHHEAQELAALNGILYHGILLTNGLLLDETILNQMKRSDLGLMISLDGLGAYHNIQRGGSGARTTFTKVKKAILLSLDWGLKPFISVTISNENLPGLPELVDWLVKKELPFSFNFVRDLSARASLLDTNLFVSTFKKISSALTTQPVRHNLLGSFLDRGTLEFTHDHPCGAGMNYLVIDPDGRVAKCQMDMAHPFSTIDDEDLFASLSRSESRPFNPSVTEKPGCQDCSWRHWCAGGCPLLAYQAGGSCDAKPPYCEIYRSIFPDALRIEGERLFRYGDKKYPMDRSAGNKID